MKNKNTTFKKLNYFVCFFILILAIITSCKKDNILPVTDPDPELATAPDISGFWIINETITGNCNDSIEIEEKTEIFEVKQLNNDLIIIIYPKCDTLTGTINGNNISWQGTLPTCSGSMDIDFSGTVSAYGTQASGSADWVWYSGTYSCSGTTQITGERVTVGTVDFEGEWQGNWHSEEYQFDGTFSADVTQNDTLLGGIIDVPFLGIINADLTGFVNGNIVFFGDVEEEIQFVGIMNADSASGTYIHRYFYDEGTWTGSKQ